MMETESKLNTISDVSEQTNHLSVIHSENVTLSESTAKKIKKNEAKELEEDVEDRDKDRKKKRKVSKVSYMWMLLLFTLIYCLLASM